MKWNTVIVQVNTLEPNVTSECPQGVLAEITMAELACALLQFSKQGEQHVISKSKEAAATEGPPQG